MPIGGHNKGKNQTKEERAKKAFKYWIKKLGKQKAKTKIYKEWGITV